MSRPRIAMLPSRAGPTAQCTQTDRSSRAALETAGEFSGRAATHRWDLRLLHLYNVSWENLAGVPGLLGIGRSPYMSNWNNPSTRCVTLSHSLTNA